MLARLELHLCAANGEHLAFERGGSVHIVNLGELHKNHLALYALARGAEGLAVHIKCAEAAQLPCAHVPGLNLDLAAHAVRVDDLSDFNIFRARARLRRALFGKETHVSFYFEVFYLFSIAESVGDGKNKKRSREVPGNVFSVQSTMSTDTFTPVR